MDNHTPQTVEELVISQKKKRKRLLTILSSIFGSLIVITALAGFLWYQNGDITGNWRSADAEQMVLEDSGLANQDLFGDLLTEDTDQVAEVRIALEVKEEQAKLVSSITFNKELFVEAYNKLIDTEYQKILDELARQAKEEGLTTEAYLSQVYGDDYETALKSSFLDSTKFLEELDKQLFIFADENGFDYNSETGELSTVVFEGRVNQLLHTVTITKINSKAAAEFTQDDITTDDWFLYTHSGDTLTILGDTMTFTAENKAKG